MSLAPVPHSKEARIQRDPVRRIQRRSSALRSSTSSQPFCSTSLAILVPDDRVQDAVEHLLKELPHYQITQTRGDYRLRKKSGGVCSLPRAMRLEWDDVHQCDPPEFILVVPQSHFHFDVTDATSTRGLIPRSTRATRASGFGFQPCPRFSTPSSTRCSSRSIDGVCHDESSGRPTSYLSTFLAYLCIYNIRDEHGATDEVTGALLLPAEALLEGG